MTDAEGMEIFQFNLKVDELYPSLQAFNGTVLIFLLKFLATLNEVFDVAGASGAAIVRTIMYYVENDAKEVH